MLYIMRGTSCSGKDTFIQNHGLEEFTLSSDNFRLMLLGDMGAQHANKLVFDTLHRILEERLKERTVITVVNATNLKMQSVKPLISLARQYAVPVTVVSIIPPGIDELKERAESRFITGNGPKMPDHVLERHLQQYESCKPAFMTYSCYDKYKFVEIDQDWNIVYG